jgi:hypothetical protein
MTAPQFRTGLQRAIYEYVDQNPSATVPEIAHHVGHTIRGVFTSLSWMNAYARHLLDTNVPPANSFKDSQGIQITAYSDPDITTKFYTWPTPHACVNPDHAK